jgi:hypothetical protein
MRLFLIGYKAHSGKDTLVDLVDEKCVVKRFFFAKKLKETVKDLYNMSDEQVYGSLKNVVDERYGITPREILQDFGQEQRARYSDIWADCALREISSQFLRSDTQCSDFFITDFRFPNEFAVAKEYAKDLGIELYTIQVNRPVALRGEFAGSTNISEIALDDFTDWSYIINNDGTKDELYAKFQNIFDIPELKKS